MADLRYANPLNGIDVTKLPAPQVVEPLDYDTVLAERLDLLVANMRDHDPEYERPRVTDPIYQNQAVDAFREMLVRSRVNDAAQQVMLAFASGANLEQLALFYRVERAVVEPAEPSANPPRPAVYETDASLLRRVLLAPEALNTAGSRGSYLYHTLTADPAHVADANIASPTPGTIVVSVLALDGDGTPSAQTLDAVRAHLTAEDVRPMGDEVIVQAAEIVRYRVDGTAYFLPGPDAGAALAAAGASWAEFTAPDNRRLGADVTISRLNATLMQAGMHSIVYQSPTGDIDIAPDQFGHCTSYSLANGGIRV